MTDWSRTAGDAFSLTFGYPDETAYAATVEQLVADGVASGIAARRADLWGEEAAEEAGQRLGWVALSEESRPLVDEIVGLRDVLVSRGLDRIVLCGMGGSSLAPEVICDAAGVELVTLDSSDPDMVGRLVRDRLDATAVVVSSKSGGTVETASQRAAFEQAFRDAHIDPAERIVVVTDPGSPLSDQAAEAGYRTFHADPEVGGRYSALTAFGLVPSGLAGAPIADLLDEAAAVRPALEDDSVDNPGLRLGALIGLAATRGVDKLVLADAGAPFPHLADWIEQLVAESTGKEGRGILPVVVEDASAANFSPSTPDSVLVSTGPGFPSAETHPASGFGAAIDAPLGAQLLLWEHATVIAGRLLGINPFDQPDVESAKKAARGLLDGAASSSSEPDAVDGDIELRGGDWLDGADTLEAAVAALLDLVDAEVGYVAVTAYFDRHEHAALVGVRRLLAERTGRPVTFGWGPRFLHSTGQLHKGGPPVGVFLQVTGRPGRDLPVPGQDFTFGGLIAAQAGGDADVLEQKGRPVLRVHLGDQEAGVARLVQACRG